MDVSVDIWMKRLAPYMKANNSRAWFELGLTACLYVLCVAMGYALVVAGNYGGLLCIIPGAFLIVRLFIIQHDCGHGALFLTKAMNDWVGRFLGCLLYTSPSPRDA